MVRGAGLVACLSGEVWAGGLSLGWGLGWWPVSRLGFGLAAWSSMGLGLAAWSSVGLGLVALGIFNNFNILMSALFCRPGYCLQLHQLLTRLCHCFPGRITKLTPCIKPAPRSILALKRN